MRLKLASTSSFAAYGAWAQPCRSASIRSMARLAPLTMRSLIGAPPRALRPVRLRQVGLQHDAGRQRPELVLVQHLAERGDGEVEIAILLHVEVDELRRDPAVRMAVVMALRLEIERTEPLLHDLHGVAERGEVDLARHRGDLHRDVLDVVAGQQREIGLEAARRLGLAQDGLAELVQVEPDAVGPALGQVAAQVGVLAGQDQRLGLVPQAGHDRRDDQARQVLAHQGAHGEADALPPLHEARRAVTLEQVVELIDDALRPPAAEGLVGERDGQLLAGRILHQPRQVLRPPPLVGRLPGPRLPQQRLRQLDRAVGSLPADDGGGGAAFHRRSLPHPLLPLPRGRGQGEGSRRHPLGGSHVIPTPHPVTPKTPAETPCRVTPRQDTREPMAPPMQRMHTDGDGVVARAMSLLSNVSTTSGRILVVDDDAGARDLIVSSLRADGHDVDVSSDGIEALRLLGREWYDLIVSNLRMPELDGPSLYSAVTQRWPAQPPPLLFLAGLGGTSDYDGFLKVIRAHVLPKPFTIRALRRVIRQML